MPVHHGRRFLPDGPSLIRVICLLVLLWSGSRAVRGQEEETNTVAEPPAARGLRLWNSDWPKEQKLEVLNAAIIGGLVTCGLLFWGYGGHSFQVVNEKWFSEDRIHGGADKLGHAFGAYVGAMSCGAVYEK